MQLISKKIVLALAMLGLAAACGSGEDTQQIECGEGTELDEEQEICVLVEPECGPNEVLDAVLGRCVRSGEDYCADGTTLDADLGQCVADADLSCAPNTQEEDGFCVPVETLSCGDGTVLHDEDCVPAEEVCGQGAQAFEPGGVCRPSAEVCGDGTTFDTSSRVCVPSSLLSCGEGTIAMEGQCQPAFSFYDNLAASPDLDLDDPDAATTITLPGEGERVSFVGTIQAPELVEGERVQDTDHLSFDAEAGQWVRIALFSLGLPEPGFPFTGTSTDFYRLSDVGAGLEVVREVVIQEDDTFELELFNMAQFLGTAPAAGGEDWHYVGYVELMEPPQPEAVDIFEQSLQGDIRNLTDNFYVLEDLDEIEQLLMILNARPTGAEAEMQIWTDATTLHETLPLEGSSLTISVPQDSFYLLLDRVHAFGTNTGYAIAGFAGEPLASGGSITKEFSLGAGEYIGISQFNESGATVAASIATDNTTMANNNQLAVSTDEEGSTSLYWYADEATDVTVTLQNASSSTIDALAMSAHVGTADSMVVEDLDPQQLTYDQPLARGQRHYVTMDFEITDLLTIGVSGTSATSYLHLATAGGNEVMSGNNALVLSPQVGAHLLYVEAVEAMGSGFTLTVEESQIFELSETSSPSLAIPDNQPSGVDDTITIGSCPTVAEIDMDIDISHTWRGDLIMRLTNPDGDQIILKDATGITNDVVGNFNATLEPVGGQPISNFEGSAGSGTWTLNVADTQAFDTGTLNSWTLNLVCEG